VRRLAENTVEAKRSLDNKSKAADSAISSQRRAILLQVSFWFLSHGKKKKKEEEW
jgi:hypothetical protein